MAITLTLVKPRKYKRKREPAAVPPPLPLETQVTPGGEVKLLEDLKPLNPGVAVVPPPPAVECHSQAPGAPVSPLPVPVRTEEPIALIEALEALERPIPALKVPTPTLSPTPPPSPAIDPEAFGKLIEQSLATCVSAATRRVYRVQMYAFSRSGQPFNREGVARYLQGRREQDASNPTLQSIACALRKLAGEALVCKLLSREEHEGIVTLSAGKSHRTRMGLWLTIPQVEQLLALPDRNSIQGRRDACILGVMLGCGLRRQEMADLAWECYQDREGRKCLVDLKGKGNKRRTVPIPSWLVSDLEAWKSDCETSEEESRGCWYLTSIDRRFVAGGLKADTIHKLTNEYGQRMGLSALNPHDLRRTLARMLRKNGADLEQIQHMLGHESIETTTIYLGSVIELAPGLAAVDRLKLQGSYRGPISKEAVNHLQMGLLLEQLAEKLAARSQDTLAEGSD